AKATVKDCADSSEYDEVDAETGKVIEKKTTGDRRHVMKAQAFRNAAPDLRFSRRGRGTPGRDRMASFGCPWGLRYRHRRGVAYPSRPRCGVEKDTPDPREHIQDRQKGPPP
ncbi:hypothetical protein ABZ630_31010, partial [Streptomyces albidoflavus]|uniref:hypothetical protein n=1 Tax=Streptomyces albidoflavus TaxID=1886 RepID=UPI0033E847C5